MSTTVSAAVRSDNAVKPRRSDSQNRGMQGVGVAAADLAAHDALAGTVADIVVEQAGRWAAEVDDLDDPRSGLTIALSAASSSSPKPPG